MMLFFSIFIIFLLNSCATTNNITKSKTNINQQKNENYKILLANISHLENKLYMLSERLNYLESSVTNNLKQNNSRQYINKQTKKNINKIKKLPAPNISFYKDAIFNYKQKNYYIAQKLFQEFIKTKENLLTDDAKFWLTQIDIKQNHILKAKKALEELLVEYPATNKTPKILASLINIEKDAIIRRDLFNRLLSSYPKTPEAKRIQAKFKNKF